MWRGWMVWLLAAAGAALAGVGAYRAVETTGGSAGIAATTAGALLLVSPFVITRLEQLSVSPSSLEMRFSKDMADQGAPKAARILDRTDLAWFAQSYSFIHEELDADDYSRAKVHLQRLLVERAAAIARREKFDATEVRTLFRNAAPTMRVLALGMMRGDLSLADGPSILDAIENSRSGHEQYQGLQLAQQCWHRLTSGYRSGLRGAIEADPQIKADPSRQELAEKILALPTS